MNENGLKVCAKSADILFEPKTQGVENETHTMNNMPLAMKIADNWQGAFELE